MANNAKKEPASTPVPKKRANRLRKQDKAGKSLEAFLEEVKRLTGLEICIYDLNFFLNDSPKLHVPFQLRIHNSEYCHYVKSNPDAFAKCIRTENERTAKAAKADRPFLHTCHAGVTDLILPVRVEGEQAGAIFLGQAVTRSRQEMSRDFRRLSEKYDLAPSRLKQAADSLPATSTEGLKSFAPLLSAIGDYLEQAEALMKLQQERALWARGQQAYQSLPSGEVNVEALPTPLIDCLLVELPKDEPSSIQIQKALVKIKGSYWKKFSRVDLAREIGMSDSHFSREFSRLTGITYRECLLETRLNAAFYLIKRNRYTIEEAAEMVGYENGCSLQRAFKTFTGLTPHKYLRKYPRAFMLERFTAASKTEKGALVSKTK